MAHAMWCSTAQNPVLSSVGSTWYGQLFIMEAGFEQSAALRRTQQHLAWCIAHALAVARWYRS